MAFTPPIGWGSEQQRARTRDRTRASGIGEVEVAMTRELAKQKCVPCEGGVDKLGPDQVEHYMTMVHGWKLEDDKIVKRFELESFVGAMRFINRMGDAAEQQGHHPDFCVHYDKVDVTLWTHAIGGLSENDFIMAAIIDDLEL